MLNYTRDSFGINQTRGIMPSSSRLIKPGRAGSMAPSELGQDSLQDESSLDGEENSEK